MTNVVIKMIKWYQSVPFSCHGACKYYPTCSNYAIGVFEEFGFFKGLFLTVIRIFKCNPFSKGGYDPVPLKNGGKNEKNK